MKYFSSYKISNEGLKIFEDVIHAGNIILSPGVFKDCV